MASEKPLMLYTERTPNGFKVTVLLEELKAAYGGPEYDYRGIDLWANVQKEPWFLAMNPNGRIPTLTDRARGGAHVMESAAILLYLVQHYDPERRFTFDPEAEADDYSEMLQWIFFTHGGIGPMQGQAHFFKHYAPEKIPYAIDRYVAEARRLYGVLELRLARRDYLAGPGRGRYSIADCNAWPWVRNHALSISDTLDAWPNVKAWVERIAARPAAQAGILVPEEGWKEKAKAAQQ